MLKKNKFWILFLALCLSIGASSYAQVNTGKEKLTPAQKTAAKAEAKKRKKQAKAEKRALKRHQKIQSKQTKAMMKRNKKKAVRRNAKY